MIFFAIKVVVEFVVLLVTLIALILVLRIRGRIRRLETRVDELQRQLQEHSPQSVDSVLPEEAPAQKSDTRVEHKSIPPVQDKSLPPNPSVAEEQLAVTPKLSHDESTVWGSLMSWATSGYLLAVVGVAVLLVGFGLLLAYLHWQVSPVWRLTGCGVLSVVLLAVGVGLRHRRRGFALALEGGSIGLAILLTFAAHWYYGLIEAPLAVCLLTSCCGLGVALALWQNASHLATLALFGGYVVPLLLVDGVGYGVILAYYVVLNAALPVIALFKRWRIVHLIGFTVSFCVLGYWAWNHLVAEFSPFAQLCLWAYWVAFLTIPLLHASAFTSLDKTLVFGLPIVALGIQAVLVNMAMAEAFSAFALGVVYLSLALWWRKSTIGRAFTLVAIGCFTLVVPLVLDGPAIAVSWAIGGALIAAWAAKYDSRRHNTIIVLGLELLATVWFFNEFLDGVVKL